MATLTQAPPSPARPALGEALGWAQENLWPTPARALGQAVLLLFAVLVFRGQWAGAPLAAGVVGAAWLAGLLWVVVSALRHHYHPLVQWLKDRLFNSLASALVTLVIVLWIMAAVRGLLDWAVFNASFAADPVAARAGAHTGATWGVVYANLRLFLVGQFPRDELWRVWVSLALVAVLLAASVLVYGPLRARLKPLRRVVTLLWLLSPIVIWLLLRGQGAGGPLPTIETRFWGGLLLTLLITVFSLVVSFPLGILLALGRRSQLPGIPAWLTLLVVGGLSVYGLWTYTLPVWPQVRTFLEYVLLLWPVWLALAGLAFQRVYRGNVVAAASTLFIEFVRGVPLITVLFMAQIMLALFLPPDVNIENAYRVMWGFALFSAAYMAENVRGGLQSIPKGQYEAAEALGLSTFQQLRQVILPQALRVVIPPITGQFIGLFKDTTLVAIVGLFDLLNIANSVIAQPDWLGLRREAYFFITIIYYLGCLIMAQVGYWLERRAGVGVR
jgi:general L-amino acid transport system permease protein